MHAGPPQLPTLGSSSRPSHATVDLSSARIELRRFPYPYRAALAICSDLDETPDAETYFELMRFLNTTEETKMGHGVGLEVGNSIYFDMPPGHFSYWNTDERNRERIQALIKSGHIDCLHSYGDLATTRAHAARALEELDHHGLSLKVWVDHAVAPTNFGADIMRGHGDEIGHPAYHADLTMAHGVRYVWRGRVSSIVGQNSPISVARGRARCHPRASTRTVFKEAAKQILGRAGKRKYVFHATNRVCAPAELRDGSPVVEFLRCNPHPRGLDFGDTGAGIGEVLTRDFLDRIVGREGCCILYTHLGKLQGRQFDKAAIKSFRLLAHYQHQEKVLVTTTRRLLDFQRAQQGLFCRASIRNGRTAIDLNFSPGNDLSEVPLGDSELSGLTCYLPDDEPSQVCFHGEELANLLVNAPDETGVRSVSVPWSRLEFPPL